jgi:hypothetical protein
VLLLGLSLAIADEYGSDANTSSYSEQLRVQGDPCSFEPRCGCVVIDTPTSSYNRDVDCNYVGLQSIPGPFPETTESIDLSANMIGNVTSHAFDGLTDLSYLYVGGIMLMSPLILT